MSKLSIVHTLRRIPFDFLHHVPGTSSPDHHRCLSDLPVTEAPRPPKLN